MNPVTVVLIDDHPPMREGIASIIGRTAIYRVVGSAGGYHEGISLLRIEKPDIVVLDISLPDGNGLDLVSKITTELPRTRVMILSMHARRQLANKAFESGADGYLLKESSGQLLLDGLRRILDGHRVLDPALAVAGDGCVDAGVEQESTLERLSPRENEVFRLLAVGQSGKEVADVLGISPKTVDNHRTSVMTKLCAGSIADLVRIAIRTGTIEP